MVRRCMQHICVVKNTFWGVYTRTRAAVSCNVCLCVKPLLTLKALITTAADDTHKYFFIVFQRK